MSSLLQLLRNSSTQSSILQDFTRKRKALTFRKRLGVYNYKVKPANYYKNPHAIDLQKKEELKSKGDIGTLKLQAEERLTNKPFGTFTNKGRFIIDMKRVPHYNIPNLDNFDLKPYVSYHTEKIPEEESRKYDLDREYLMGYVKDQLILSRDPNVRGLSQEIFETEEGKMIVEEFLERNKKMRKLKITNF